MVPDRVRDRGHRAKLGDVCRTVRDGFWRRVDRIAKSELRRVRGEPEPAAEERSEGDEHWIAVPGSENRECCRRWRPDRGMNGLPQRGDTWNESREELDDRQDRRHRNHGGMANRAERSGKGVDPSHPT